MQPGNMNVLIKTKKKLKYENVYTEKYPSFFKKYYIAHLKIYVNKIFK